MQRMLAVTLVGMMATAGCTRTSGSMGTALPPNFGETVFAYWNKYRFKQEDKKIVREERTKDAPTFGKVLHLALIGFRFNPHDDQRYWNQIQRDEYYKGLTTQPYLFLTVHRADDLKSGDKVEFDSDSVNVPNEGAFISNVSFSRGRPRVLPMEEYPEELKPLASRVKVELELSNETDTAGGLLMGTVKYEREKNGNDSDDAVEGELEMAFTAQVISERLGECNYGNSEDADSVDPCGDLE